MALIMKTILKGLSMFGLSPSMIEVMYVDQEEAVAKAKFVDHLALLGISYDSDKEFEFRLGLFTAKD
jgi:hypothetical protein